MISFPINLSASGLAILFLWVTIGSLGLPGGTIAIIAFGSLAGTVSYLILLIAISFAAAVIGDVLAFELAVKFSDEFRNKLRHFSFFRNNESKAKEMLTKYGFQIVFFTRFALLSLCPVVSYVSGFEKMNRKKFLAAVLSGEFLFAAIYSIVGFTVGETFNSLISAANYIIAAVLLIVLLLYLLRLLLRRYRRNNFIKL